MANAGYAIPAGTHRTEEVIERSRFITTIARASTADDARVFIDGTRREFKDATHNCWAFVAGPAGSTAAVGMSDAGEPHGTAGRPMLDVLVHSGIGEIAAVVTRYYGGVKLGKGGLMRAYGGCVQNALASLPTLQLVPRVELAITAAYADVENVRRLLDEYDATILENTFGANVTYHVAVPLDRASMCEKAIIDRTAARAQVEHLRS